MTSEQGQTVKEDSTTTPEVITRHTEGLFIYYHPDHKVTQRLKTILQTNLPNYLVAVVNEVPPAFSGLMFPAEIGVQTGDTIGTYNSGKQFILSIIRTITNLDLSSYLPRFVPRSEQKVVLEGGNIIHVGGTNTLLLGLSEDDELRYLTEAGYTAYPIKKLDEGLGEFLNSSELPDNEIWVYGGPTSRKDPHAHIDLCLTGFSNLYDKGEIVFYMDDLLLKFLQEKNLLDPILRNQIKGIDHKLVLKGACNIKYIQSNGKHIAFVPSIETIGPIATDLRRFGYDIVELGEDQVSQNAGIKCRSLDLKWRRNLVK